MVRNMGTGAGNRKLKRPHCTVSGDSWGISAKWCALLLLLLTACTAPAYHIQNSRLVPVRLFAKPLLLTFDDGPAHPVIDRAILAVLRKHHAKSIWFVNCKYFADPANVDTLHAIIADGHQIANHTATHAQLPELDAAGLQREIGGCSETIKALTGKMPVYFRPPSGRTTPAANAVAHAYGMQVVGWSSDSSDSLLARFKVRPQLYMPFLDAYPVYDPRVTAEAGGIVLFHDYPNTQLALDGILTALEARGFTFVAPG